MADVAQILTIAAAGTVQAAAGTVTGQGQVFRRPFSQADVQINVTAAATLVGDTLDVFVDTSYDGGATWVNLGHCTQVLGNGGVKRFILTLGPAVGGATSVQDASVDAAVGTTRQIGLGDRLRYRGVVVGTGSFTFGISAYLKP